MKIIVTKLSVLHFILGSIWIAKMDIVILKSEYNIQKLKKGNKAFNVKH